MNKNFKFCGFFFYFDWYVSSFIAVFRYPSMVAMDCLDLDFVEFSILSFYMLIWAFFMYEKMTCSVGLYARSGHLCDFE